VLIFILELGDFYWVWLLVDVWSIMLKTDKMWGPCSDCGKYSRKI